MKAMMPSLQAPRGYQVVRTSAGIILNPLS